MLTFSRKQNQPQPESSSLTQSKTPAAPTSPEAHPLLHLQRTVGNQAVLQLLQAGGDGPEAASYTEASPTTEGRLESAVGLRAPAASGLKGQVQRKSAPKPDPAMEQWVVDSAMRVLDDVLDNETSRIIDDSPTRYRLAFEKLYQALVGRRLEKQQIRGRERRELFAESIVMLAPLLTHANESQLAKLM